jgi:hypothetical protein
MRQINFLSCAQGAIGVLLAIEHSAQILALCPEACDITWEAEGEYDDNGGMYHRCTSAMLNFKDGTSIPCPSNEGISDNYGDLVMECDLEEHIEAAVASGLITAEEVAAIKEDDFTALGKLYRIPGPTSDKVNDLFAAIAGAIEDCNATDEYFDIEMNREVSAIGAAILALAPQFVTEAG